MPHRPLTPGELTHARAMFGDAIAYTRVRIHARKYVFFQPRQVAMAPNGQIYFPRACHKPDFSGNVPDTAWLLHELTHVWQHQHGRWVRTLGTLARGQYDYGDLDDSDRAYADFNIEQQAAIVGDYFLTTHGYRAQHGQASHATYAAILPFLPRPDAAVLHADESVISALGSRRAL